MDWSSWLRGNIKKPSKSDLLKRQEELLGVTDQLIDTVKSFSFHTFKNFPLQGKLLLFIYFFIYFFFYVFLPHVVCPPETSTSWGHWHDKFLLGFQLVFM